MSGMARSRSGSVPASAWSPRPVALGLLARRMMRRAAFAFGPCLLLGVFLVLAYRS